MKRDRRIANAWLAVLLFMLQGQARAWGPGGHMIVAFIAHDRLNPKSKAEADRLIALNIEPTPITSKSLNFVNASNWPDDLRPVKSFANTLELHFADFPFLADGTQPQGQFPAEKNILTALAAHVNTLKTSTDDKAKAQALRFIIHFVGDIHQPLHCVGRITAAHPGGDQGGNLFEIKLMNAKGELKPAKLHSYWDGGINDFPKAGPNFAPPPLEEIPPAAARVKKAHPDTEAWKTGASDFKAWAEESEKAAEDFAYKGIKENAQPLRKY